MSSLTNFVQRARKMRIVIVFLVPLLVLSASAAAAQPNKFSDCKPTSYHSCGGHDCNVSYPFRTPGMPEHCGHPAFELKCKSDTTSGSMPVMDIAGKEYKVGGISYELQIVNIVNPDALGETCPRAFTNTTIDFSLFDYTDYDLNVTLYFNCSPQTSPSSLRNVSCPGSNSSLYRSYFYLPTDEPPPRAAELSRNCSSVVLVPIYGGDNLGPLMRGRMDFLGALQNGLDLSWVVGKGWCEGCQDSGGVCGRNVNATGKPACFCPDGRTTDGTCETKPTHRKSTIIIVIGAGAGGALILGCCIFLLYNRRKKQRQASLSNLLSRSTSSKISSKKDPELGDTSYHTHIFSYDELEEATNGFNVSRELGDGGFGTVYKGKLRDGRTVAVKRLYENNYRRLEQFMNEVKILSSLRHQNLVTLYGCTSRHSRELLLVYEYIPNGTLADHLHGHLASDGALPWPVRMSIAIETADALAYLHAVEPQIIHRDVKTNNILLDNSFHVKVADFGLSRLFPLDATHVSTAPQGTPGYVDPEYHQCYQLTDKSDVYSFGVVLVELISSKPAVDISRHRHEINLSNMAITKIQNCQIDQLVDPGLGYQSRPEIMGMINQVAELAFRCLQSDREMRPCIKEVLEVLKTLEGGGNKAEKEAEVAEVQMKEETRLLKTVSPFSPDSVTERWSSRLTTPNTST